MLHRHLPQIVVHIWSLGRHIGTYCHAASRGLMIALSRIDSPCGAFRVAWRKASLSYNSVSQRKRPEKPGSPLLIHYHISQNDGSSFELALKQAFGARLHCYDTPRHEGFLTRQDIVDYVKRNPDAEVIVTHQAVPPAPPIRDRRVVTSILIRDPIARIRSIYAFERRQRSNDPGPVKARELDFKSYVEWRLGVSPGMICNYQVHFCCRKRARSDSPIGQVELGEAIMALDGAQIVGTVERYNEWLALAQSVMADCFGSITLLSARASQTSNGSGASEAEIFKRLVQELGSDLVALLVKRNELDMCLHQVADSLLTRRLAERSVTLQLQEAYRGIALSHDLPPSLSGKGKEEIG